jgi:hypothetical protein
LSQQLPLRLIEGLAEMAFNAFWYSSLVYWAPRSPYLPTSARHSGFL